MKTPFGPQPSDPMPTDKLDALVERLEAESSLFQTCYPPSTTPVLNEAAQLLTTQAVEISDLALRNTELALNLLAAEKERDEWRERAFRWEREATVGIAVDHKTGSIKP